MPLNACIEEFLSEEISNSIMRVATISLKRTPERWNVFLERNQLALSNCEVLRIDGVDGSELLETNISTRLITQLLINAGVREL